MATDRTAAMMSATAQAISPGAEILIPHPTIRALQATRVEAMAGVAAMVAAEAMAAEAINNALARRGHAFGVGLASTLDSFQSI
jgi:hypothetical protein